MSSNFIIISMTARMWAKCSWFPEKKREKTYHARNYDEAQEVSIWGEFIRRIIEEDKEYCPLGTISAKEK